MLAEVLTRLALGRSCPWCWYPQIGGGPNVLSLVLIRHIPTTPVPTPRPRSWPSKPSLASAKLSPSTVSRISRSRSKVPREPCMWNGSLMKRTLTSYGQQRYGTQGQTGSPHRSGTGDEARSHIPDSLPHQYYLATMGYTVNVLVHLFFLNTHCVPDILLGYIMRHLWSLLSRNLQSRKKLRQ